MRVRFDIWEQGNVSPLQLTDKLRGALRHALCDVIMELRVLPNPLCLETFCTTPGRGQRGDSTNGEELELPLQYLLGKAGTINRKRIDTDHTYHLSQAFC